MLKENKKIEEGPVDIHPDLLPVMEYNDLIKSPDIVRKNIIGRILSGRTITGETIQTVSSGKRITLKKEDNYIMIWDSEGNLVGQIGDSAGGTRRYISFSAPLNIQVEMMRLLALNTTGSNIILNIVSGGYQTTRLENKNIDAYRTTNNIPILDIRQNGTGSSIRILDDVVSTGIPISIEAPSNVNNVNPTIKIVNRGAAGDIELTNRAADPTTGVIGQLCVVAGVLKICTVADPLTWTVVGAQT